MNLITKLFKPRKNEVAPYSLRDFDNLRFLNCIDEIRIATENLQPLVNGDFKSEFIQWMIDGAKRVLDRSKEYRSSTQSLGNARIFDYRLNQLEKLYATLSYRKSS